MAPRKTDEKKVPPDRARIYWDKAQDFFRLMRDAAQSGNWNGAGLAAVHCAISATDALLVAKAGRRSSSKAHEDAADLVVAHIRHAQAAEQAKRLRGILRTCDPAVQDLLGRQGGGMVPVVQPGSEEIKASPRRLLCWCMRISSTRAGRANWRQPK